MLTKVKKFSIETFLLGDINVNYLVKSSHKEMKELFITHGLHQLVKIPARVMQETKYLIDVIMTNTRSNVHRGKDWVWVIMIVSCVYVKLITEKCRSEQLHVEIIPNTIIQY